MSEPRERGLTAGKNARESWGEVSGKIERAERKKKEGRIVWSGG